MRDLCKYIARLVESSFAKSEYRSQGGSSLRFSCNVHNDQVVSKRYMSGTASSG